jgi:hypothetical protein
MRDLYFGGAAVHRCDNNFAFDAGLQPVAFR